MGPKFEKLRSTAHFLTATWAEIEMQIYVGPIAFGNADLCRPNSIRFMLRLVGVGLAVIISGRKIQPIC
jgi:hypothetical protein